MWQYQRGGMSYKRKQKEIKNKGLCIEIGRIWNIKCITIPVIIGATGLITKGLKNMENHTRKVFNRFATKDSCTWNITHNTESTAF